MQYCLHGLEAQGLIFHLSVSLLKKTVLNRAAEREIAFDSIIFVIFFFVKKEKVIEEKFFIFIH